MNWIAFSNILQGAFDTATGITNTVIGGKNYRTELEVNKDVTVNTKTEDSKTIRTIIMASCALIAIMLAGIFIFQNRK